MEEIRYFQVKNLFYQQGRLNSIVSAGKAMHWGSYTGYYWTHAKESYTLTITELRGRCVKTEMPMSLELYVKLHLSIQQRTLSFQSLNIRASTFPTYPLAIQLQRKCVLFDHGQHQWWLLCAPGSLFHSSLLHTRWYLTKLPPTALTQSCWNRIRERQRLNFSEETGGRKRCIELFLFWK